MTKYTYTLPIYIIPAVFYGDESNVTAQQARDIQLFLDEVAADVGAGCWSLESNQEPEFRAHNDYDTLAGDTIEVNYITRS